MVADLFVPSAGIYLLNHSVGRPPRSALGAARTGFFTPWEQGDSAVWPAWFEEIDRFRTALARLLNGRMADFCPQTNLSGALTKLIHALPRQPGKTTIAFHEQDFPSMGFVLRAAGRLGWNSHMIPAAVDPLDLDSWRTHLTADIGVALVTHVHSNTSAQLPVAEITRLARERDVVSIVDVAQSIGVVPIDLERWQADFVLGSCVKWLCGGPGAGFLWGGPDRVDRCEPLDLGWFSHADPFEFDINNFRYAEGILRFWGGTPSVLPYVVAANSIEVLRGIGIDTIRQHNLALNQRIIDRLAAQYLVTPPQPEQRGGTLVLSFGESQGEVEQRLHAAKVHFDARPTGLRMSPHIYNTTAEIDRVIDCLTG